MAERAIFRQLIRINPLEILYNQGDSRYKTMKSFLFLSAALCGTMLCASAQVRIDEEAFGSNLGGWTKRGKTAAEYSLSGNTYRTFRPEVTPTPDGGIFVSVRIDHVRGIFASNDHATLEVTIDSNGLIVSAQSNIAIQGRSISSDVILGTTDAGQQAVGVDRAVQIGTELVANLSAKLLREKIVESGRVTYPAAVRHNYNLLYQSIRVERPTGSGDKRKPAPTTKPAAEKPAADKPAATDQAATEKPAGAAENAADKPAAEEKKEEADPANAGLTIRPYTTPGRVKPQGD